MAIAQDSISTLFWNIGYAFCHQIPERSFFFADLQMPLCARDTGTYLGFLIIFAYWVVLKRYRNGSKPDFLVLALAAVGMLFFVFDGVSSYLGFYTTNNAIRLFTGLLMGVTIGLLLLSVFPLVAFKKTIAKKTFTRKDLIPVYLIVAFIVFVIISFDFGILEFYTLESLSMAGLIILLFIVMLASLHAVLKDHQFFWKESKAVLFILAFALEAALITTMWYLHDLTTTVFG
jgi:uncharacterized membrane protein